MADSSDRQSHLEIAATYVNLDQALQLAERFCVQGSLFVRDVDPDNKTGELIALLGPHVRNISTLPAFFEPHISQGVTTVVHFHLRPAVRDLLLESYLPLFKLDQSCWPERLTFSRADDSVLFSHLGESKVFELSLVGEEEAAWGDPLDATIRFDVEM